ncbi:MAG TPA: hypothetical protein VJ506_02570 [Candidatus Limnocylindrales bacterium]|nr:hypothetical protein [Candidatus Limnocylindrales bacterium]
MTHRKLTLRTLLAAMAAAVLLVPQLLVVSGVSAAGGDDTPILSPNARPLPLDEQSEEELLAADQEFIGKRLAGDRPLTLSEAGQLRSAAAHQAQLIRKQGLPTSGPTTFSGAWTALGPNPIVQVTRSGGGSFAAMSGRIGALAIRPSNGQLILGAAQGGIWLYDPGTGTWAPKTDDLPSLSTGALAIAPSNDAIVYAGTGEGALSGDSYFGNGIMKSTDGGQTWSHVSGDYFESVSIARLVVDPTNPDHLYAAVLRGRGGAHRTSPALHSKFGVWESKDGAQTWNLIFEQKSTLGATDLEMDPQAPLTLFASFWGDKIYKSTDGGAHWAAAMNGLPNSPYYASASTRFSISLSHPSGGSAVLYAGFDWYDSGATYHPSRVFKSTDLGANWTLLPAGSSPDSVQDYCGSQCFYDNVIEADPTNPDVVFAAGQFDYGIGSGGIFRSDDGGQTWKNLGWNQHPDFHALAFNPANTADVVIGSDGGVWYSTDRGGRPNASDPLSAVTWQDLNGTVDPNTAGVLHRTGLAISQFTSIGTVPQVPGRFWGGTQDNGTLRKSTGSASWFDVAGGDGGQVLVDPTVDNSVTGCVAPFAPSCYVYGTFYGITPYRFTDGGASFFGNQYIRNGINLNDRSEFYIPFTMNLLNTSQLFLGTYRLYRTDNARAASAGDVRWKIVSPDLTSGCTGTAPNGARGCVLSAIGVGGGTAVYVGTDDGLLWISPDGQTAGSPSWIRLDQHGLPKRPVAGIAVDRSNYRIAYVAYNGFNPATPGLPGHVFKTTDGGDHWANVSGNLPDVPVNSVIIDPSFPNTLYAGTDVGPFVSYDGGVHWNALGTGFPIVSIWQLDLDPGHRVLAAGTHGRGAFRLNDGATIPAFVVSKVDAGIPVGSGSTLDYTVTLRNIGNGGATGVTVTDPVPANTSFVSAADGGTFANGKVTWSGISLSPGASVDLHFSVSIGSALKKKIASITNDGIVVTSAEGPGTSGSPTVTPIAPPYAVSVSPASQSGAARAGTSVDYHVSIKNLGFNADSYGVTASGGSDPTSIFASDCSTPLSTTATVNPGTSTDVCVEVTVPGGANQGDTDNTTITATSVGSPAVSGSAAISTMAVKLDTLLVDGDGNAPDVQSYYTTALTSAGMSYAVWDLAANPELPTGLLRAYRNIVWFTGNSYPGPITPYEADLQAFLDNGGRLFMSGQDILDQAAGTTSFVHDYLHITWDGSETQNDKSTANVHGVSGNPISDTIGPIPLDHTVLGAAFEDRITPNGAATPAFTDDTTAPDALNVDTGTYKVVFLAFPFEAYGSATDKATLMGNVFSYFGP